MGVLARFWHWLRSLFRKPVSLPPATKDERDELAEQWEEFNRNQRAEFEAAWRAGRVEVIDE